MPLAFEIERQVSADYDQSDSAALMLTERRSAASAALHAWILRHLLQAKKDLERLKAIRLAREEKKKARLKMEEENKRAKEQAAAAAASSEKKSKKKKKKEIQKLSKIEIKKMKPPQLKEALKERGLSTQGNKKELIKRLTEANE